MTVTGARLGSVALSSKFGPEPGRIRVLRGTRRVVLFKDAPRKNECVITAYSYPAITAIERLNAPLKTLPRGVRLSEPEVLRLLIPDYESKVLRNTFEADGSIDPLTLYRASIFNARRTNLGLPGRDLLVVLIHEVDTECTACHASILGVVDLSSRRVLGTYKQEGLPITLALTKTSSGPWPILFTSWMGNRAGAELHRQATPRITATGDLTFEYSDAQELTRQE